MPLRTPQRANVATLSLRSCLREVLHLQILRRCFKEKHRHGRRTRQAKEKVFAICDAPYFNIIYQQTGGASPSPTEISTFLLSPPAARGGKMAGDTQKTFMFFSPARYVARHGSGFQRRQPLARFLGSFFAAWQRMNIYTAQRTPISPRRNMEVQCERQEEKLYKI